MATLKRSKLKAILDLCRETKPSTSYEAWWGNRSHWAGTLNGRVPSFLISWLWFRMGHYAGLSGIDWAWKLMVHCSTQAVGMLLSAITAYSERMTDYFNDNCRIWQGLFYIDFRAEAAAIKGATKAEWLQRHTRKTLEERQIFETPESYRVYQKVAQLQYFMPNLDNVWACLRRPLRLSCDPMGSVMWSHTISIDSAFITLCPLIPFICMGPHPVVFLRGWH